MDLIKLRPAMSVLPLALPLACATGNPTRALRPATVTAMQVADTIAMPVMKIDVPEHPDSVWAVATATKMLAGNDTTQHFRVLHLCQVTGAYLVDLTPTAFRPHPMSQPIVQLGGGGIVFISLYGEAVVVVAYQ